MDVQLQIIPLSKIDYSPGNPRSDADVDLAGLAASLGDEKAAMLVTPPVVQGVGRSRYRVIAGERRVRAAVLAGWQSISCQVRDDLDAHTAHQLRVVENLHRRDLNPLDEATALKISWLAANGDALEKRDEVENLIGQEKPQRYLLLELESLLEKSGFVPTRPPVTWDEVLNRLGVEMKPASRKKLMRVLAVDPKVQETVRDLSLTEAALRSLGTLEPQEQKRLAKELKSNPDLTRKVRRIARVVRSGTHTLDEALSEARGQVAVDEPKSTQASLPEDERMTGFVIQLLEAATSAQQAADGLRETAGADYETTLPEAWRMYAEEALKILRAI